jgi:hypothetical protein
MTAGQRNILVIGKARSTKQAAFIGYKYSSDNSDDNLLTFNHWGANELVTINGQGDTTIAGNLAVDTNTLFVDSTNNRIGVGTASPTNQLHIYDSANANDQAELKIESFRPTIRFQDRSTSQMSAEITGDNSLKFKVSAPVDDDTPLTTRMTINTDGTVDFANGVNVDGNIDFSTSSGNPYIMMKNALYNNMIRLGSAFRIIGADSNAAGSLIGTSSGNAMTFSMQDTEGYGWAFRKTNHASSEAAMSLTVDGKTNIAHSLRLGYGYTDTTTSGATHTLDVSGSISSTSTISATTSNASTSTDLRKITTSTSQPSGGADGDIWIVVPS